MKPLIHVKVETVNTFFPMITQRFAAENKSLTTEEPTLELTPAMFSHLLRSNNDALLHISEMCSRLESEDKDFTEGGLLETYSNEFVENYLSELEIFEGIDSKGEFENIVIQLDETKLDGIYEYSKKVHPSFEHIDITKSVRKVLRKCPHLYYEFLSGGITDTAPRETYSEQLQATVADYHYDEKKYRFKPFSAYEKELNKRLWGKLHGSKTFRFPSEFLESIFTELSEIKAYKELVAGVTANQFKHIVYTKPEITRIAYIAFCRLNYIEQNRWQSKPELNAALTDNEDLSFSDEHEGDVIIKLKDDTLGQLQGFLVENTVNTEYFSDMANVITFAKNNLDFYLELLIDDKTKIFETFIGRAIRLAV